MQHPRHTLRTILVAGLLAGTLDILAAFLFAYLARGSSPIRVLQYIASGVFGMEAFEGGLEVALWGLAFHFIIAFAWTVLLFVAYPRISLLARNKNVTGTVYGCIIWLVMNLFVLPLTNVPQPVFHLVNALIGTGILILAVGIPIALVAGKHFSNTQNHSHNHTS